MRTLVTSMRERSETSGMVQGGKVKIAEQGLTCLRLMMENTGKYQGKGLNKRTAMTVKTELIR